MTVLVSASASKTSTKIGRTSRPLRAARRPPAACRVRRSTCWLHRPAQTRANNLRNEASLPASAISRQTSWTRAGEHIISERVRSVTQACGLTPSSRDERAVAMYRRLGSRKLRPIAPTHRGALYMELNLSILRTVEVRDMTQRKLPVLCRTLPFGFVLAADGKAVSYKTATKPCKAFSTRPRAKAIPRDRRHHECGGERWVKNKHRSCQSGYVTLRRSLSRQVATTPDMAHEIMRGVPEDRAKRDLHAAVEFSKRKQT